MNDDWEARVSSVWANTDSLGDEEVVEAIDALVAERGDEDAAAVFEAASARDYVGLEPEAEPLYRRAIELGLDDVRRPQAVIQLASTLRNLERYDEAIELLRNEFMDSPGHPLFDAASAFLALTLASRGDTLEATAVALDVLGKRLPQYGNAVRRYAAELAQY